MIAARGRQSAANRRETIVELDREPVFPADYAATDEREARTSKS